MKLRDLNEDDSHIFKRWFQNDSIGRRFLAEYENIESLLKLINSSRKFWLAYNNENYIGFLDLEVDKENGYFSFYVAPNFRNKGLSTELLSLLEKKAHEYSIKKLFGHVEMENTNSIRSLQKAGYLHAQKLDKDNLLKFSKKLA